MNWINRKHDIGLDIMAGCCGAESPQLFNYLGPWSMASGFEFLGSWDGGGWVKNDLLKLQHGGPRGREQVRHRLHEFVKAGNRDHIRTFDHEISKLDPHAPHANELRQMWQEAMRQHEVRYMGGRSVASGAFQGTIPGAAVPAQGNVPGTAHPWWQTPLDLADRGFHGAEEAIRRAHDVPRDVVRDVAHRQWEDVKPYVIGGGVVAGILAILGLYQAAKVAPQVAPHVIPYLLKAGA